MILIDSYGWIEYFANGPLADEYAQYIESASKENVITPTIVLFEVYRRIKAQEGEQKAIGVYAQITATQIVNLDEDLALKAADISLGTGLGMADSIILAAARRFNAELVTSDRRFEKLPKVRLII